MNVPIHRISRTDKAGYLEHGTKIEQKYTALKNTFQAGNLINVISGHRFRAITNRSVNLKTPLLITIDIF